MRGKHSPRPTRPLRDFHGIYTVAPQMSALFERLPNLRSGGPVEWSGRMTLRSVAAVPLEWDA